MSTPVVYSEGDWVMYSNRLCVIGDILVNPLGYKTIRITDVDTGMPYTVSKHSIEPAKKEDIVLTKVN